MSIQKKIALLFFTLNTSVILLLSGAIFYFVHQFTFGDFYKRLEARVNIAAQIHHLSDKDSLGVYKEIRHRYLEKLQNEQQYIITLVNHQVKTQPPHIPAEFIDAVMDQGNARYKTDNTFYA